MPWSSRLEVGLDFNHAGAVGVEYGLNEWRGTTATVGSESSDISVGFGVWNFSLGIEFLRQRMDER